MVSADERRADERRLAPLYQALRGGKRCRDWFLTRSLLLQTLLGAVAVVLPLLVVGLIAQSRDALMLIEARTERVEYRVVQAIRSRIGHLDQALVIGPDGAERCLGGTLEPLDGTTITYALVEQDLVISFDADTEDATAPAARLHTGAERLELDSGTDVVVIGKGYCSSVQRVLRLPVHGPVTVGTTPAPPERSSGAGGALRGLLLDGEVSVFGRRLYPSDRLYPAGSFTLTGGTVLASPPAQDWAGLFGYVMHVIAPEPDSEVRSLQISGTAMSPWLEVERSALGSSGTPDSVRIEVSVLTSLFRDPLLLLLQGSIAIFFAVLQLTLNLRALREG